MAARAELDPAKRAAMYRRAERILHDDAPWIWEYHQQMTEVTQPYVRGYAAAPGLDARLHRARGSTSVPIGEPVRQ